MNSTLKSLAAVIDALHDEDDDPGTSDNASVHASADDILLIALRESGAGEVADAYERLRTRVKFWYE